MKLFAVFIILSFSFQPIYSQCVDASVLPSVTCQALSADETFANQTGSNNGTAPDATCSFGTASAGTSTWATFTYSGAPTQQYLTASQSAGGPGNDPAMAIYSYDGCTLLGCNDDNPDGADPSPGEGAKDGKIDLTTLGLTIGSDYLVRIYNEGNANNAKSALIHCTPSAPAGDCFTDPVEVTDINTTFTTTTNGSNANGCCTWTEDQFGAVPALNCPGPGSISSDGNIYYSFEICAAGTVTAELVEDDCNDSAGSQIWFIDDCNGNVIGNQCHNEGDMSTGTLSYANFTIGQTYYIMVDSYAGNVCDVTLTMTGPICITPLGVNVVSFDVEQSLDNSVIISWSTEHKTSDEFVVEKSYDGFSFETIVETTNRDASQFEFTDQNIEKNNSRVYYRLSTRNSSNELVHISVNKLNIKQDNIKLTIVNGDFHFIVPNKISNFKVYLINKIGQIISEKHVNELNSGTYSLIDLTGQNTINASYLLIEGELFKSSFKLVN